jgi:hypothetical protein
MKRTICGGLLATALAAVFSLSFLSEAQAECMWNIDGRWVFRQLNGIDVDFKIIQRGTKLTGRGSYGAPATEGGILGTIHGNHFSFTVSWGGVYDGDINAEGGMAGQTHDSVNNPASLEAWYVDGQKAQCVQLQIIVTPPSSADPPAIQRDTQRPILKQLFK